jgi:hypothetical protein
MKYYVHGETGATMQCPPPYDLPIIEKCVEVSWAKYLYAVRLGILAESTECYFITEDNIRFYNRKYLDTYPSNIPDVDVYAKMKEKNKRTAQKLMRKYSKPLTWATNRSTKPRNSPTPKIEL